MLTRAPRRWPARKARSVRRVGPHAMRSAPAAVHRALYLRAARRAPPDTFVAP